MATEAVPERPFKTVYGEREDDAGDVNSYRAVFVEEPHWIFDGQFQSRLFDFRLEEYIMEKKLYRERVANPSIVDFIYMWLLANILILLYICCVSGPIDFIPAHYELLIFWMISCLLFCTISGEHLWTFRMLLRDLSILMGKRSDEEEEDDEEEDLEPKIVSVPAFPSKYFIAKEVDRVLRGKGTKKCVLLMYEKTYDCLNSVESRCCGYVAFFFCVLIPFVRRMSFCISAKHPVAVCFFIIVLSLYIRALYLIGNHGLLLHNICKAQRSGDLQIRLKD
ncbi:hypothetical protein QR680_010895 [Steinernema hermaphroditum]|uniref:Uncharacterized protein n=1 Tax=Steinernema hermaphroditum TaxID=289476 RepID=A0AA39MCK0_9BILA|nr:hypothetical protein QR680_010895 [Steinernema hermaphroditum]